jgi:hypothetical protein
VMLVLTGTLIGLSSLILVAALLVVVFLFIFRAKPGLSRIVPDCLGAPFTGQSGKSTSKVHAFPEKSRTIRAKNHTPEVERMWRGMGVRNYRLNKLVCG